MASIRYSDGETDVMLGDRVRTRLFFLIRSSGRVVYIPGISAPHQEMEHDGIRLVGVKFDSGGFGGFWVEPSNSTNRTGCEKCASGKSSIQKK